MVQAFSDERNLPPDVIYEALELALAAATKKRFESDIDVRVAIDKETGDFETFQRWEVLEDDAEIEFPDRQLFLIDAKQKQDDIEPGQFIEERIPEKAINRISAATARQIVIQKVREAEREKVLKEYGPRKGEMVAGEVRRIDKGDAIVNIDGVEALLPRHFAIPKDGKRQGDRIRAILHEVRTEPRGPQLILNRICPELLIELFKLEVPETREGLIEVKTAARDPGVRAKISVRGTDSRIDPIGACVGVRGSRVQSVSKEIASERVDIVEWDSNPAQFAVNALMPAVVEKVFVDASGKSMRVAVKQDEMSKAIGRVGQNVKLASQLIGWEIDIMSIEEFEQKATDEAANIRTELMETLDVDEDVAMVLVENNYTTTLEIAYEDPENLERIEQFDAQLVERIIERAAEIELQKEVTEIVQIEQNVPDETLYQVEGMDEQTAIVLAAYGIRTMEDLADAATDELLEVPGMEEARAKDLIMAARAPMFASTEA